MSRLLVGLGAGVALAYTAMALGQQLATGLGIADVFGITAAFMVLFAGAMVVVNR